MFKRHSRNARNLLFASIIAITGVGSTYAQVSTFEQFTPQDTTSEAAISYDQIDSYLKALGVVEDGRYLPAYDVIRSNGMELLDTFISNLSRIEVTNLNENEQLAYWLNIRNLMVIKAFADQKSLSNYKSKRGTPENPGRVWLEKRATISGVELSIHDIEKNIILSSWNDPNIIYGLYQGLSDGPAMHAKSFSGKTVQTELEEAGRQFAKQKNSLKIKKNTARISQYYYWYKDDVFEGSDSALRAHLSNMLTDKRVASFNSTDQFKVKKLSSNIDNYRPRQNINVPRSGHSGYGAGGS